MSDEPATRGRCFYRQHSAQPLRAISFRNKSYLVFAENRWRRSYHRQTEFTDARGDEPCKPFKFDAIALEPLRRPDQVRIRTFAATLSMARRLRRCACR